jgi:hypothetical protein
MILRQRDLRTIGILTMISVGVWVVLLTPAIGWTKAWLGAVVAIPGGLLAGALYVASQHWTTRC